MQTDLAEGILTARAARRPVALLTWLATGEQRLVTPEDAGEFPALAAEIADGFRLDRSGTVASPDGEVFIRIFNPPLRLIIIGAVHAAQFLLPLGRMLGHDVTIVDPRTAFASEQRFPDANLVTEWPEDALAQIGIDRRTAIVALTHDPKIDDGALRLALESKAFYVGALGSSRTHAKRAERLAAMGVSADALARIHAPIGLDIGAQGPAEIALSVMAQLVAVLREKGLGPKG
ncbi:MULTISPECIES: XdhC family protein [Rhodomicrobium]|uniref:XdhC family protein n=1 Tax=Rhodomicrobium TaxID=1068 RepID=UPI000B4B5AB6|nr:MULTISPECIES: XdhC family protein [Rhodomicrobium]